MFRIQDLDCTCLLSSSGPGPGTASPHPRRVAAPPHAALARHEGHRRRQDPCVQQHGRKSYLRYRKGRSLALRSRLCGGSGKRESPQALLAMLPGGHWVQPATTPLHHRRVRVGRDLLQSTQSRPPATGRDICHWIRLLPIMSKALRPCSGAAVGGLQVRWLCHAASVPRSRGAAGGPRRAGQRGLHGRSPAVNQANEVSAPTLQKHTLM